MSATECCFAPVPLSPTDSEALVASLAMVRLPVMDPLAWGAKTTPKLTLCPAATDSGNAGVLLARLIPAPVTAADEIVAVAVPVFVTATDSVELCPTVTL
ncbi:MAG TPA: hypothetical protein VE996_13850, partial [Terriglobales bacterium]|nr:hypothetical protein [Terriglobales bacterium]